MKITIISGYFFPDITPRSFRTTELAKEFAKRGYEVDVIIPFRNYDYTLFTAEFKINIKYFSDKILTFPYLPKGNNVIKKIYRGLVYQYMKISCSPYIQYKDQVCNYLQEKEMDVVISIAAPHSIHWGVSKALMSQHFNCRKWIADCGDPFMGDQTNKHPFYFKKLEKLFCSRVDYITVPIEQAIMGYYSEFRYKIKVVPQGFDFSSKKVNKPINNILTFCYAGILYPGYRDLDSFVNYLDSQYKNFDYRFVLYTKQCSLINKYKQILGNKIEIKDFVPRDQLLLRLSEMHFLINIKNAGTVQAPSKLIDYYLSGTPVLDVGNLLDTENVDSFMRKDYTCLHRFENMNDYNIINVVDKFETLIK